MTPAFCPRPGRLLDLACGRGGNALWLALRGWRAHGVDVDPARISYASRRSVTMGVSASFAVRDLEREGIPPGPWDAVLVLHYLDRELLSAIPGALAPAGLLAYKTHLRHRSRPPEARPRRPAFLLESGELLRSFRGLQVLDYREWASEGQAYAALLARKPISPPPPRVGLQPPRP